MNPFHNLTDDQLAEWHQLTTKVERLEADLKESRKAVEAVQNFGMEERQKLRAELNRRGDLIAELKMKEIHALSGLRSTSGALVETLKALRELIVAVNTFFELYGDDETPATIESAVTAATAVVLKYDIPFGAEPLPAREQPPARDNVCEKHRCDLDAARANTRREKERVTTLVEAAREFMRLMFDHLKYHPGEHLNGETHRAWQALGEVCDAARPVTK